MKIQLSVAIALMLLISPVIALDFQPAMPPDPCTYESHPGTLIYKEREGDYFPPYLKTKVFYHPSIARPRMNPKAVVLIVNANFTTYSDYAYLAEHYARQGYFVKIAARYEQYMDSFAADEMLLELNDIFTNYNISWSTPVALVGHSKGGGTVVEMAKLIRDNNLNFNLKSVISIAPNVDADSNVISGFDGHAAPSYLAIYGSQDEDMGGTSGLPREAFAGYDRINHENSTSCNDVGSCFFMYPGPGVMSKAMVYVYGADHSGFINHSGFVSSTSNRDYLSVDDQFCINKAYTTGFLKWHIDGISSYKAMFTDDWRPPSVAAMTTIKEDHNCLFSCGAAGSPLKLFQQYSAPSRMVLANFETPTSWTASSGLQVSRIYPNNADIKSRHQSQVMRVRWENSTSWRRIMIPVANSKSAIDNFDRLSLRVGRFRQSHAILDWGYINSPWIGLVDSNNNGGYARLADLGDIPNPDRRVDFNGIPNQPGHLHMRTLQVPLSNLSNANLTDISWIYLWINPNSRGDIIIDNIEVIRN